MGIITSTLRSLSLHGELETALSNTAIGSEAGANESDSSGADLPSKARYAARAMKKRPQSASKNAAATPKKSVGRPKKGTATPTIAKKRQGPTSAKKTSAKRSTVKKKRCELCNHPHDGSYGSSRFCSVRCSKRASALSRWADVGSQDEAAVSKASSKKTKGQRANAVTEGFAHRLVDFDVDDLSDVVPDSNSAPATPREDRGLKTSNERNRYNCELCGKAHNGKFGSGRFCSSSCSKTRWGANKMDREEQEAWHSPSGRALPSTLRLAVAEGAVSKRRHSKI